MPPDVKGIDLLSERQKEILRLTARHHQIKEIARLLKISENTVKTHLGETRRRLGGITTKQAIRLLLEGERNAGLILEVGDLLEVMQDDAELAPSYPHEQASFSSFTQRHHDNQLQQSGASLGDAGSAGQAPVYPRRDRDLEGAQPDPRPGEGDLQSGRGGGVADGQWDGFRGRLRSFTPLQWLAVIIGISVALPLFLSLLVQAAANVINVFQSLHAPAG